MRILIVEDEIYIAEAVAQVLKRNHYSVDIANEGEYGLDCGLSGIYDLIILDIMLPKMDGISVLKELRKNKVQVPILLLTARDQVEDKVIGLDNGADDYLPKPFHMNELLARLRAMCRRKDIPYSDDLLQYDNLILNPNSLMVSDGKNEIKLTLKESQILELLIRQKSMILSKESMIEKIWGYDSEAEDRNVETHISLLRKKINSLNALCHIRTIRGLGYLLERKEA